jgi:hypothetical protein
VKTRQEILYRILLSKFSPGNQNASSIEINQLIKFGLYEEIDRTYRKLGGICEIPPLKSGKWDICLDKFIVELDEEQHFNRYRLMTFDSYIYHVVNGFDVLRYKKYCIDNELICLKKSSWGKYWTSSSTEKQFGLPGINGDLENSGSPRWRQRAFYDYLRDAYSLINGIPLIRISIYDELQIFGKTKSIGLLISRGTDSDLKEIEKFIERKLQKEI